jgi:predicted RNA-binding protein with PUA-like domain
LIFQENLSFWLVKQEPSKYSWDQFLLDKETFWDGVRNYQARNNLKKMKKDDLVFFYHSIIGKEIKGVAKISKEFYPDPTINDDRWVVVNLKPLKSLLTTVTLEDIKNNPKLINMSLIKQSRLSVMPLTKNEFMIILRMGQTKISGL